MVLQPHYEDIVYMARNGMPSKGISAAILHHYGGESGFSARSIRRFGSENGLSKLSEAHLQVDVSTAIAEVGTFL